MPLKQLITPLGIVGTGLFILYQCASAGAWTVGLIAGILAPALAIMDWAFLRRDGPDCQRVADRMLFQTWMLLLLIGFMAESL